MRRRAVVLAGGTVLGVAALARAAAPQAAPVAAPAPFAAPVRLEEALALDPAVRIGRLPNGMTYYIRKNGRPEKRVSLRLAVNAGSVLWRTRTSAAWPTSSST
jgi:zinc protease